MSLKLTSRRFLFAVFAACLAFAAYSLQGERGFVRLGEMLGQRNEMKARVHLMEAENARLSEQVGRLRDDPASIEALARTRLDMVRPGEVVFVFSPELEGDRP